MVDGHEYADRRGFGDGRKVDVHVMKIGIEGDGEKALE